MKCERKEGIPPEIFECANCGRPFKLLPQGIGLPVHRTCLKRGLGDYVATAIELSGIGPLYRRIRGKKCGGCQQRQEALNEMGKMAGL